MPQIHKEKGVEIWSQCCPLLSFDPAAEDNRLGLKSGVSQDTIYKIMHCIDNIEAEVSLLCAMLLKLNSGNEI